jgi:hypothetical protein
MRMSSRESGAVGRAKKIDRQVLLLQFLQAFLAFQILRASESVVISLNVVRGEKVRWSWLALPHARRCKIGL